MTKPKILPVIMSGGSGTRLWPLSTDAAPKQFHALTSGLTMIQETAERVRGADFLAPVVICSGRHRDMVTRQLAEVGVAPAAVVLEPFGRNTAAVAAIAAALGQTLDPDARVLLLPADHVVQDRGAFLAAIDRALAVSAERIVTFGIHPSGPETGYGYIEQGEALSEGVFAVRRFAEKPDLATAERYLARGGYHWNGGIFLYAPEVMLSELRLARPDIADAAIRALQGSLRTGAYIELDPGLFLACPSESIDYAVMEATTLAAVAPCDIGWADVGSFSELWRLSPKDAAGNAVSGPAVLLDTEGALVLSEGPLVAALGLKGVMVVAAGDVVMVGPLDRAQDVKKLVEAYKARAAAPSDLAPPNGLRSKPCAPDRPDRSAPERALRGVGSEA